MLLAFYVAYAGSVRILVVISIRDAFCFICLDTDATFYEVTTCSFSFMQQHQILIYVWPLKF